MNPDKLFDYLDGKLPPEQRAELERQLVTDKHLQRELVMAREIHSRAENAPEVILPAEVKTERGAILGRRVAIAFAVLVFMNVLFGLYAIGFMENKKRRAQTATDQNRQQLAEALQKAAASALPTPTLDIGEIEIKLNGWAKQKDVVADRIIAAAVWCGGSAAKNVSKENSLLVFAEIPANRENDFRQALTQLGAAPSTTPGTNAAEHRILQIRITQGPIR